jgi:diguanylate cyclase (GGDEF)-like protein
VRPSLRFSVLITCLILLFSVCVLGVLAIDASLRAANNASALGQRGIVPAVGLNALTQNLDEERELVTADFKHDSEQERKAVLKELRGLDSSIRLTVPQALSRGAMHQWHVSWDRYVAARTQYLSTLAHNQWVAPPAQRIRLDDRLDAVTDVVQRDDALRLNVEQKLYVSALNESWREIQVVLTALFLTVGVGAALVLVVIGRLTNGLSDLTLTAQQVASGKLEVRARESGSDEITTVAHAFNHMLEGLLSAERRARTDPLTGIGNHRSFQEDIRIEISRARRYGQPLSLAMVDLDDFKVVNDRQGHAHGDRVLLQLGELIGTLRVEDKPYRLGGDEFALILPFADNIEAAIALERFREQAERNLLGETVSVGLASLTGDVEDAEILREQADLALYEAKRRGRNTVVTFEEVRDIASIVSSAKINAVRQLLEAGDVAVAFQPIVLLDDGTILAYEALMRPPAAYGLTGPQEVFDIAEKLGRAPELDQVCRRAIFARAHELPSSVLLFINVTPQSLDHARFSSDTLMAEMEEAGIDPGRVVWEITERSIARIEVVVRETNRLRALGVKIGLDDVGAGNAGLEMLRRLPVDYLKIDRGVISEALVDTAAAGVLAAIIAFAQRTNTYVIAEGIETEAMLAGIKDAGRPVRSDQTAVQAAQGYLFARPQEHIEPLASNIIDLRKRRA